MRSNLKKIISLLLVIVILCALVACGGEQNNATNGNQSAAPSGASGGEVVIRLASAAPASEFANGGITTLGVSTNYFIDEIAQRTDGRITAKLFPDGQLAKSVDEHVGGLLNGAFDVVLLNNGSWADYTNAYAGLNVPYLYFTYESAWSTLDSEIGDSWRNKAKEDVGVYPLAFFDIGFRQLTNSTHAIVVPDDLKGVKIRAMADNVQMACWEALGAAVTPVAYAELYTALQQKLVDAQENPPSNIVSSKLYELQAYMTITNHNFTASVVTAGPVFWEALSAEDQALIQEVFIEAQNYGREKTEAFAEEFIQEISDSGVEVTRLSAEQLQLFQDKAKTVWPMIEEQVGAEEFKELTDYVNSVQSVQ